MSDPNSSEDPKIVVDDDYKTRVQQEKEQLREQMDAQHTDDMQMPPASFPMLVTTLATQALSNLGHIPDPIEGKPVIRKSLAKHFIDSISMLEEKTKGNLDDDEYEMLEGTLHQLRMAFVSSPDSMPADESDDSKGPSLELPS